MNFTCSPYRMWCTLCLHQSLHMHTHWLRPLSQYLRLLPYPILYAWKRSAAVTPIAGRKLGNASHVSDITAPRLHMPYKPRSGWDLTPHGGLSSCKRWSTRTNKEQQRWEPWLWQLTTFTPSPGYLMSQQDSTILVRSGPHRDLIIHFDPAPGRYPAHLCATLLSFMWVDTSLIWHLSPKAARRRSVKRLWKVIHRKSLFSGVASTAASVH